MTKKKTGVTTFLACLSALLTVALAAPAARAAAIPVKVDLTFLRALKTYAIDPRADDEAYLLVTGIAKGQELALGRHPKEGAWAAGPKKPAVTDKEPVNLWQGELNDGEFAQLTITLLNGKASPDDPKIKEFLDRMAAADKSVAETRGKMTLTADDFKKLSADTLKAHQDVIIKVSEVLSRDAGTDHFAGQFTLLLWNDGTKIVKRLDPVGLTYGEHYGSNQVKLYTKLKLTLKDVMVQDDQGQWFPTQLNPVSDDKTTVRVKMLENEYVPYKDRKLKNVTDYLADIQVRDMTGGGEGKPLEWTLGGEVKPEDSKRATPVHTYWNWAE